MPEISVSNSQTPSTPQPLAGPRVQSPSHAALVQVVRETGARARQIRADQAVPLSEPRSLELVSRNRSDARIEEVSRTGRDRSRTSTPSDGGPAADRAGLARHQAWLNAYLGWRVVRDKVATEIDESLELSPHGKTLRRERMQETHEKKLVDPDGVIAKAAADSDALIRGREPVLRKAFVGKRVEPDALDEIRGGQDRLLVVQALKDADDDRIAVLIEALSSVGIRDDHLLTGATLGLAHKPLMLQQVSQQIAARQDEADLERLLGDRPRLEAAVELLYLRDLQERFERDRAVATKDPGTIELLLEQLKSDYGR